MDNKNHEDYLEKLEIQIAEKMLELAEGDDDVAMERRTLYRRLAEKDVEIDRLKKYHNDSLKVKREARKEVFKAKCERRDVEDRYDDLRLDVEALKEDNKKLREACDEDEMEEYKRQGLLED